MTTHTYTVTFEAETSDASLVSGVARDWADIVAGNRNVVSAEARVNAESTGPSPLASDRTRVTGTLDLDVELADGDRDIPEGLLSEGLIVAAARFLRRDDWGDFIYGLPERRA